jgi:hypothetical protein
LTQYNHYLSLLRLHSLTPTSSTQNSKDKDEELFSDLITFICQVAQCYPEETKELPAQLKGLLMGAGAVTGDVRRTIIRNLVMLRNKDVIDSIEYVSCPCRKHELTCQDCCKPFYLSFPTSPRLYDPSSDRLFLLISRPRTQRPRTTD